MIRFVNPHAVSPKRPTQTVAQKDIDTSEFDQWEDAAGQKSAIEWTDSTWNLVTGVRIHRASACVKMVMSLTTSPRSGLELASPSAAD